MGESMFEYLMPGIVMIWVLCAVFASVGARQRGRSEFGWMLVGLFFGVFALLVFAMPYINADGTLSLSREHSRPAPAGSPLWVSVAGFGVVAAVVVVTVVPNWEMGYAELQDSTISLISYIKSYNLFEYL